MLSPYKSGLAPTRPMRASRSPRTAALSSIAVALGTLPLIGQTNLLHLWSL
jgi:hypothetical protein